MERKHITGFAFTTDAFTWPEGLRMFLLVVFIALWLIILFLYFCEQYIMHIVPVHSNMQSLMTFVTI